MSVVLARAAAHPVVADFERFMTEVVYPAEPLFAAEGGLNRVGSAVLRDVVRAGKDRGLWNLFGSRHPSAGELTAADLAELCELAGRSPVIAQVGVHSLNPDSGVLELLAQLGTRQQQERWLEPLTDGTVGSGYCMTEPGVASSDPQNLRTRAEVDGSGVFRVSGVKSWVTGALEPENAVLVVLAVTDPDAPPSSRHSMLLVPGDAPGVAPGRNMSLFGFGDLHRGGHPQLTFDGAPGELLGRRGGGLQAAQSLLGPARVLHCLRLVGTAERALELLCRRLTERSSRGRPFAANDLWIDRVADCRIRIESMRALVRTLAPRTGQQADVTTSLLKAAVPAQVADIVDLAIQAHGADGFDDATILGQLYLHARSLRISDGADELHRMVVGRHELRKYRATGPLPQDGSGR